MSPFSTAPPVFIHSNWRTGGTALIAALRRDPRLMVFIDPLNPGMERPWSTLRTLGPTSWQSGHPEDLGAYFTEYASLIHDDHIRGWSGDFFWSYDLAADADDPAQEAYLRSLIATAHGEGRTPVIKMEQSEGRINWLRSRFPEALHVGITRDWDGQFSSWATQLLLYGGDSFFAWAHAFVVQNPRIFGHHDLPATFDMAVFDHLVTMFDAFHVVTSRVRAADCDVAFDVSPESTESVDEQVARLQASQGTWDIPMWADALAHARQTRPTATLLPRAAWKRIHAGHMRVAAERDAWRGAHDDVAEAAENRLVALEAAQAQVAAQQLEIERLTALISDRAPRTGRSWRLARLPRST